jgi:hypothetical protein
MFTRRTNGSFSAPAAAVDNLTDNLTGGRKRKPTDESAAKSQKLREENTARTMADAKLGTLNLEVVGSTPTRLTIDSTAFRSFATSSRTASGAWVTCKDGGSSRRSTAARFRPALGARRCRRSLGWSDAPPGHGRTAGSSRSGSGGRRTCPSYPPDQRHRACRCADGSEFQRLSLHAGIASGRLDRREHRVAES